MLVPRWILGLLIFSALQSSIASAEQSGRYRVAENAVRELVDYLLESPSRIGSDPVAQERWLHPDLQLLLTTARSRVQAARKAGKEEMGPDPSEPDSDTFFHVWDLPSACAVTSSKPYKKELLVFLSCGWGKDKDFAGMKADYTFTLRRRLDRWLVSEVSFSDERKGRSTLTAELREKIALAKRFESRGRW